MSPQPLAQRRYFSLIAVISVLIPVVVAILLYLPKGKLAGWDVRFLPLLNACINSTVTVLLLLGYAFIRRRWVVAHRATQLAAVGLSALFLISYVLYHYQAVEVHYGGHGPLRYVYFFILTTHILLSMAIVPLVLLSLYRAYTGQFIAHKKLARVTLPLWLYVSITGVVVYLLISPYYA